MATKAHPERVDERLARAAMRATDDRGKLYTQYILAHYRVTGSLAPGCDAKDLYAWYEVNMADELAARTRGAGQKQEARLPGLE